jgi:hypothetical protein
MPPKHLLGLSLFGYLGSASALATNLTGTYSAFAAASYGLVSTYNSGNFFSDFSFYTGADPTHGYVSYQSESAAASQGLINTNNGQVYLGVDYTTVNPSAGRASVRISSNEGYTHGLFIADIAHMPGSICGVWPAFWLFGPNWPNSGEVSAEYHPCEKMLTINPDRRDRRSQPRWHRPDHFAHRCRLHN